MSGVGVALLVLLGLLIALAVTLRWRGGRSVPPLSTDEEFARAGFVPYRGEDERDPA